MKKIFLSLFVAAFSFSSFAQTTIANGNMENWDSPTGAAAEPSNWNSGKTASGSVALLVPQTCYRDASTLNGGSYCAKVVTTNYIGTVVNGALTTGQLIANSTVKAEGYIRTQTADATHRMDFVGRPDSIVFWYKYTPSGTDYPRVEARLHISNCEAPEIPVNNNHPLDTINIVARALWTGGTGTISNWTRVSVPFSYRNATTPAYILITSTSSGDQNGGTQGSILWLDEFSVVYNPTIACGTINATTYYVSAATGASVNVPFTLTGVYNGGNTITAQLSDANGSFSSPTTIGSIAATTSGTVSATIPANTASGTGYRIRVVSSSPGLTAADNGANITVVLASNSIAPTAAQTIPANVVGGALSVTETSGNTAREWKFTTTSGSGYQSFGTAQTGTAYTPLFANAGTYYVVCVTSYPNGITVSSNEVAITVVENSIAPTASQSILVGVNGNLLTVTESPVAISREWFSAATPGGPYTMISPMQMGTTYTPNFLSAGTYYVVCESFYNGGVTAISNEVLISVGNATITTGTVNGSPFLFSPSAPDAIITVPYTTSGTFNAGNIFTAQLSDANGSFTAPTTIGSLASLVSGNINATVPHTVAAGTGYRVRVISSNPVVLGSDNGVDMAVDQFNNSIAPTSTQNIMHGVNGTAIAVTSSQTSTSQWKYSTTSGSGYGSFAPAETGSSYTPNFVAPGTYYVVAVSTNSYNDSVTSAEVQIDVTNGTTLTTSAVAGSPFYVSDSLTAAVDVDFTSDVVFNAGNIFKAQLSDYNGSFTAATEIGSLSGSAIGTIHAVIPGNTSGSSAYRIRVISTDPALTGTDNGADLQVVPFEVSITPMDTQNLPQATYGNVITATTTQTATYQWLYTQTSGSFYAGFAPPQTTATYTPRFPLVGTYYVACKATNSAHNATISQEVVVIVSAPTGIKNETNEIIKAYWSGNDFVVDLSASTLSKPRIELINMQGQVVLTQTLNATSTNLVRNNLSEGIYLFRIIDGDKIFNGKSVKK